MEIDNAFLVAFLLPPRPRHRRGLEQAFCARVPMMLLGDCAHLLQKAQQQPLRMFRCIILHRFNMLVKSSAAVALEHNR